MADDTRLADPSMAQPTSSAPPSPSPAPGSPSSTLHFSQSATPSPSPTERTTLLPGCTPGPHLYLSPSGRVLTHPPPPKSTSQAQSTPPHPSAPHPPYADADEKQKPTPATVPVIWVDFPPQSPANPFFFPRGRKLAIMAVGMFFAQITAFATSSFSIGFGSMQRDLGMTDLQAAAGVSLLAWGFAIGPLVLAPLTEELGRFWFYLGSVAVYGLFHLFGALAQNVATVLVGRFLLGMAGCIGATIVAGTVSDIYPPHQRGLPMALFTVFVTAGPGMGAVVMCWVEANPRLGWRWIQWIQMIAVFVYLPIVYFCLCETRAPVILRRRAARLRKERGMADGGRYTARGEVDKKPFWQAMRLSLSRPIMFLLLEPIVTFFAIWAALVWGVFFIQIAGLPYAFKKIHNFSVTQSGLTYLSIVIGTVIGFFGNFFQDAIYRRRVAKDGVEARLYAPMFAGILFAAGCMVFGLTLIPSVHWIWPCIGIALILIAAFQIYNACFVYLSECYGSHASSAVAGMSCLRIVVGSSFALFTEDLFDTLTVRWGVFLMGCIALPLAAIPFVAFWKGPWIRERSPYSKRLMAEEQRRVEAEQAAMKRGVDVVDGGEGQQDSRGVEAVEEGGLRRTLSEVNIGKEAEDNKGRA